MPVVPDKPEAVAVTLQSSQADTRCSRYDMRECVFKCTRSSSKPKRENRREINYTNLNDGLDEEDVYLPPRKKPGRKGPGSYPSEERLRSHDLQNDCVWKKQKLTKEKEKELDLEKIMDDSDTLPDIVQNRPVLNIDKVCVSNNELPLSLSSLITSDAELSNSEELGLTVPLTPDEFAEAAVSAAIENITNTKPMSKTTIPNKDILLPMDEASGATKKPLVSATNDSGPQVTTTMSKENNRKTETPSS